MQQLIFLSKKLFFFVIIYTLFSFQEKKIQWVALGDSITYLNDHQQETGNRITKGYMTMVNEQLPNVSFVNQGHNGWTVLRIAEEIDKLGITKADMYSVFLGTNDWWRGNKLGDWNDYLQSTGTQTVMGAYRVIIDKIKTLNPKAKVILITPMQRVDFVYILNYKNNALGSYQAKNGQSLKSFADAIKRIAAHEGYRLVDLYHSRKLSHPHLVKFKRLKDPQTNTYKNYAYPDFIGKPFDPEKDEYPYPEASVDMTFDGLHPSDEGYKVITKMLVKEIRSLFP